MNFISNFAGSDNYYITNQQSVITYTGNYPSLVNDNVNYPNFNKFSPIPGTTDYSNNKIAVFFSCIYFLIAPQTSSPSTKTKNFPSMTIVDPIINN
jgi:hypothetical protein